MAAVVLPDWALKKESYTPDGGRALFISRSLLRLLSLLARFRAQGARGGRRAAAGGVLLAAGFVLLVVCARSAAFLWLALAAELCLLAALPARRLRALLARALGAALGSAALLLPAFFFGGARPAALIPCKTFLTAGALGLLTEALPWHFVTGSLRAFGVPPLFVQVLDLTLKAIAMLGESALAAFTALKLRAVGRFEDKAPAFSGVLGTTLLRARTLSEETHQAMVCRGFTGDYPLDRRRLWTRGDAPLLAALTALAAAYLYLER